MKMKLLICLNVFLLLNAFTLAYSKSNPEDVQATDSGPLTEDKSPPVVKSENKDQDKNDDDMEVAENDSDDDEADSNHESDDIEPKDSDDKHHGPDNNDSDDKHQDSDDKHENADNDSDNKQKDKKPIDSDDTHSSKMDHPISLFLNKTEVYLYMRQINKGLGHEVINVTNPASIKNCSFNRNLTTYLIIHDFGQHNLESAYDKLKSQLLSKEDSNVLALAWNGGNGRINPTLYQEAVKFVPSVGKQLARFLHSMSALKGLQYTNLHIIGDGLGAHIAGVAGEHDSDTAIASITGLDPAGINYSPTDKTDRLSAEDATYVSVIHTNGCREKKPDAFFECYGAYFDMGDTDFFPHDGQYQDRCVHKVHKYGKGRPPFCDHDSAMEYYLYSMNISMSDTYFLARSAPDYNHFKFSPPDCGKVPQYLGYYANAKAKGSYYLNVSDSPPYAVQDPVCPTTFRKELQNISLYVILPLFVILAVTAVLAPLVVYLRRRASNNGEQHPNIIEDNNEEDGVDDDDDRLLISTTNNDGINERVPEIANLLDVGHGSDNFEPQANSFVSNILLDDPYTQIVNNANDVQQNEKLTENREVANDATFEAGMFSGVFNNADLFDDNLMLLNSNTTKLSLIANGSSTTAKFDLMV